MFLKVGGGHKSKMFDIFSVFYRFGQNFEIVLKVGQNNRNSFQNKPPGGGAF